MSLAFVRWKIFSFIKLKNKKQNKQKIKRKEIVTKIAYRCRSSLLSICGYEVIVDIYIFLVNQNSTTHNAHETTNVPFHIFCLTVSIMGVQPTTKLYYYSVPNKLKPAMPFVCSAIKFTHRNATANRVQQHT